MCQNYKLTFLQGELLSFSFLNIMCVPVLKMDCFWLTKVWQHGKAMISFLGFFSTLINKRAGPSVLHKNPLRPLSAKVYGQNVCICDSQRTQRASCYLGTGTQK